MINCGETYETDEDIKDWVKQTEEKDDEEEGELETTYQPTKIKTKKEARNLIEQLKEYFYSNSNESCNEIAKLQQIQESLNQFLSTKKSTL